MCIQRTTLFSLCPSFVWLSPPFGIRHRCWTSLFILSKPVFLFLLCGPKLLEARSMAGTFALKYFCGSLWYRLPEVYLEERNPVPGDEFYPTHSPFFGSIYNFMFPPPLTRISQVELVKIFFRKGHGMTLGGWWSSHPSPWSWEAEAGTRATW